MGIQDMMKWNVRASALYAVGVWTMIGSYGFLKYSGRLEDVPEVKTEDEEVPENLERVVHETAHSKTVIYYKKDFVPYHIRISNFIKSFTSGPKTGDDDSK
ncbi:small integral membrane protein 26-like [Notolabrus celidotus]|uniref:small integral membrane protein 26-like n=1 Tax=Notolabrus celidotus TaxID=1203425 RepID=UPI0014904ABD|nr:small integral membrane protein 26-like [Notolabrus celidotus]